MRRPAVPVLVVATAGALVLAGCGDGDPTAERNGRPTVEEPAPGERDPLRALAPDGVMIGTAVAGGGHFGRGNDPFEVDERYRDTLASEFSSVTPENQLKWESVRPGPGEYDFEAADAVVAFAEEHGMAVRGHTLFWHSQNPGWLEGGDFTPEELRTMLREHIETVVGRYAGRIAQWDVANEIFDEDGQLRTEENIWLRELGPEIIADAFRWAHEADPAALLFLNDFNAETLNPKTDAYYALVQELLAQDVPVHGFGSQAHLSLEYGSPGDGVRANLQRFADLGLATAITELDVRIVLNGEEPTDDELAQQAQYYQDVVAGCLAVEGCDSITLWGFTDRYSWVPSWFEGLGAANVMDEEYGAKPAYAAVAEALAAGAAD